MFCCGRKTHAADKACVGIRSEADAVTAEVWFIRQLTTGLLDDVVSGIVC